MSNDKNEQRKPASIGRRAHDGRVIEFDALINGLAHEIRNPLSSILTAADLVQGDPGVSEETEMLLGVIKKESRRLSGMLHEFLSYVRPRISPACNFNLTVMLRRACDVLRVEGYLTPAVTVVDELPENLLCQGDEERLQQALYNVVQNALEAMQGQGTLHLYGEECDGKVCVRISDSGPGLSSEDEERAFEPFYSTKPEGTGLGLAIARAALHSANGGIWAENQLRDGQRCGACVCIELPLAQLPDDSSNS